MLSKITAIIMTIISIISGYGAQLTSGSEVLYDVEYGKYTRQVADVVFPGEYEPEQGVILFIHGGGWISGSKSGFTSKAISMSKKFNCITASMNYRYASEKVDCEHILDDIDKTLAKIKDLAQARGIKTDKVMLVGYSAGAHLALLYSYSRKNTAPIEPAAVVSYSGPADLTSTDFIKNNALSGEDFMLELMSKLTGETITKSNFNKKKSALLKISPISYVSSSCVPTLIVQGSKDRIVFPADTREFAEKLEQKGVTYRYFELKNSGHQLKDDPDDFSESNRVLAAYVKKYIK
ncbi:MAG: alpha/beta hydrolase [Ruminococcaceae bacterium]|nr:alpha/beta hydrolase [Oscillospiraceae bacterium]